MQRYVSFAVSLSLLSGANALVRPDGVVSYNFASGLAVTDTIHRGDYPRWAGTPGMLLDVTSMPPRS